MSNAENNKDPYKNLVGEKRDPSVYTKLPQEAWTFVELKALIHNYAVMGGFYADCIPTYHDSFDAPRENSLIKRNIAALTVPKSPFGNTVTFYDAAAKKLEQASKGRYLYTVHTTTGDVALQEYVTPGEEYRSLEKYAQRNGGLSGLHIAEVSLKKFSFGSFEEEEFCLQETIIEGCNLDGVDFENCDATGARFISNQMTNTTMNGVEVSGAEFDGNWLHGATLDVTCTGSKRPVVINNIFNPETTLPPVDHLPEFRADTLNRWVKDKAVDVTKGLASKATGSIESQVTDLFVDCLGGAAKEGAKAATGLGALPLYLAKTGCKLVLWATKSVIINKFKNNINYDKIDKMVKDIESAADSAGLQNAVMGFVEGFEGDVLEKVMATLNQEGIGGFLQYGNVIVTAEEAVPRLEQLLKNNLQSSEEVIFVRHDTARYGSFVGQFREDRDPAVIRVKANGEVLATWYENGAPRQDIRFDATGKIARSNIYYNDGSTTEVAIDHGTYVSAILQRRGNGKVQDCEILRMALGREQVVKLFKAAMENQQNTVINASFFKGEEKPVPALTTNEMKERSERFGPSAPMSAPGVDPQEPNVDPAIMDGRDTDQSVSGLRC